MASREDYINYEDVRQLILRFNAESSRRNANIEVVPDSSFNVDEEIDLGIIDSLNKKRLDIVKKPWKAETHHTCGVNVAYIPEGFSNIDLSNTAIKQSETPLRSQNEAWESQYDILMSDIQLLEKVCACNQDTWERDCNCVGNEGCTCYSDRCTCNSDESCTCYQDYSCKGECTCNTTASETYPCTGTCSCNTTQDYCDDCSCNTHHGTCSCNTNCGDHHCTHEDTMDECLSDGWYCDVDGYSGCGVDEIISCEPMGCPAVCDDVTAGCDCDRELHCNCNIENQTDCDCNIEWGCGCDGESNFCTTNCQSHQNLTDCGCYGNTYICPTHTEVCDCHSHSVDEPDDCSETACGCYSDECTCESNSETCGADSCSCDMVCTEFSSMIS